MRIWKNVAIDTTNAVGTFANDGPGEAITVNITGAQHHRHRGEQLHRHPAHHHRQHHRRLRLSLNLHDPRGPREPPGPRFSWRVKAQPLGEITPERFSSPSRFFIAHRRAAGSA